MSYDLVFWKQTRPSNGLPADIYAALMDGTVVPELGALPIDEWIENVLRNFPDAVREPNGPASEWIHWAEPDGGRSFHVDWSQQHVRVTLRPLDEEVANRHIDIAAHHGGRLYDPQVDERFA